MKTLYAYAAVAALCCMPAMAADTGGSGGGLPLAEPDAPATDAAAAAAAAAASAVADALPAPAKPAKAPRAAPAKADDGLEEAIVLRGTFVVGSGDDVQTVGPGGTVRLSAKEVARGRADGTLVDPNAEPLPEWQGPAVVRG